MLTQTKTYRADDAAFANAQIGYAPVVGSAEAGDAALRYLELTWREVEPEEDVYAWDAIDAKYGLADLRAKGIHLVLRFVCDTPRTKSHMDIPDWLYAKTQDGSWYDTRYGRGYSPDYANAAFRAAHHRVLCALAEHFGTDGFVTYVELGSLGHWGEWHIRSEDGFAPMPGEAVRDAYAADYEAAFPTAKLLMRRPFNFAARHGLGLYNDMTGEEADTREWLGWIAGGGWYGSEPKALSAMPDFWQRAPVGGEFTSGRSMQDMLEKDLARTVQLVKDSHMSFIGPKTAQAEYTKGYNAVLRELGYRLRVTQLKLAPCEGGVSAVLTVTNEGTAPFYWDWAMNLYVEDAGGTALQTVRLPLALPELLPGQTRQVTVTLEGAQDLLNVWKQLFGDRKRLTVGIVDPMTGRDAVRFAMKAQQKNGRTVLLRSAAAFSGIDKN